MSFSVNKIILIGSLGKDAETRVTQNNVSITNFSVATSHSYKGKDENWVNETTWHNCTLFNPSDFTKSALKKGAKVYVEGRLSKKEYTDKEGIKRYSVDVMVEKVMPLDKVAQSSEQTEPDNSSNNSTSSDNNNLPF